MNKHIAKISKGMKALRKALKRAWKSPFFRARYHYVRWYEKGEIDRTPSCCNPMTVRAFWAIRFTSVRECAQTRPMRI